LEINSDYISCFSLFLTFLHGLSRFKNEGTGLPLFVDETKSVDLSPRFIRSKYADTVQR
jgi:hypothetical protein